MKIFSAKGLILIFIIGNIFLLALCCPLKVITNKYYKSGTIVNTYKVSLERKTGSIKEIGTQEFIPSYEEWLWNYDHGIHQGNIIQKTQVDIIKLTIYEIILFVLEYILYIIYITKK